MLPSQRILIVDDDRNVTVWLATLFRRFGFQVSVAEDGVMAMSAARSQRPDVVLLDLNLPAGNGMFVLESLKKNPDLCSIAVVIMSGDPLLDPEEAVRQGADAALPKTTDAITLLQTVRTLMEQRLTGSGVPAWT